MNMQELVEDYRYYYHDQADGNRAAELVEDLRQFGLHRFNRADLELAFKTIFDIMDNEIEEPIKTFMLDNAVHKIESESLGSVSLRDVYHASIPKADFEKATSYLKELNPETHTTIEYRLKPMDSEQEAAILELGIEGERRNTIHWKHLNSIVQTIIEEEKATYKELDDQGINTYKEQKLFISKEKK